LWNAEPLFEAPEVIFARRQSVPASLPAVSRWAGDVRFQIHDIFRLDRHFRSLRRRRNAQAVAFL
jgi:hypothetical protein